MKKLFMVLCICVMLAGCGKENTESSYVAEVTEIVTEQAETEIITEKAVENIKADVDITLDKASEKLWSLIKTGEENQHLAYEEIRDYGERQCYLFREYNDFESHRATTGWYAVDVKTGECFDALNELIPLENETTVN